MPACFGWDFGIPTIHVTPTLTFGEHECLTENSMRRVEIQRGTFFLLAV